jgi:hypothetical protein
MLNRLFAMIWCALLLECAAIPAFAGNLAPLESVPVPAQNVQTPE